MEKVIVLVRKQGKKLIGATGLRVPSRLFAQGLVGQRRNSIGIVIPDILNQFFANFVQSIEQEAIPQGYFPQVFSVNGFHENIDYFIEQFSGGTQKGLILAAPGASQEIVDKVQTSTNVPMVFTDQAEVTKMVTLF